MVPILWHDAQRDQTPSPYSHALGYDPEKRTYHICYWDRKQGAFVVPGLGANRIRFWVELPEPPEKNDD